MLRKLLRQNVDAVVSNQKTARLRQLREYVCLREGLNAQAAERASADFKAIATKYKLNSKQLIDLISLLGQSTSNVHTYLRASSAALEVERLNAVYRNNQWYSNTKSLTAQIAELKARYPEAAAYTASQSERLRAIKELEAIFVTAGPKYFVPGDDNTINRLLDVFTKNTRALINSLEAESANQTGTTDSHTGNQISRDEILDSIRQSFSSLHADLHSNPGDTYGQIRKFIDHHLSHSQALTTEPARVRTTEEGLVEGTKFENDDALIEQEYVEGNVDGAQLHFQPWEADKKTIYESSDIPSDYTGLCKAIVGLSALLLLYKLYQGDGTVVQFTGLAVLFGYGVYRHNVSSLKGAFPYVQQIQLHRDGRLLDIYLKEVGSSRVKVVEGVPVEDFKLHRGDHTFADEKGTSIKLNEIRKVGVGAGSWIASYGRTTVFVPQIYTGSGLDLEKVFGGRARQLTH